LSRDHLPHLVLTRFSLLQRDTGKPYPWNMTPFGFALVPQDPLLFHALFGQLQRTTPDTALDAQRYNSILTTLLYTCYREMQDSSRQEEARLRIHPTYKVYAMLQKNVMQTGLDT
jgi:hypothetical protein